MSNEYSTRQRARELSDAPAKSTASAPTGDPLIGALTKLVPIDAFAHAKELYRLSHKDDDARAIWDYMPSEPFLNKADFARYVGDCAQELDPLCYAMIDQKSGAPFGMASYMNIVSGHGSIEIGSIWIAPHVQRTRAATEVIFLLMRHAFEELNFRRLEWKCNSLNKKSRNAATRFGFSYEGTFYHHYVFKGKNRDTAWFSITAEEWPAIAASFGTWLADDNFDADGQQKVSLAALNWA